MYHIRNFHRKGWMTVIAVVALGAASASAQTDATTCRVALGTNLAKLEASVQKAVGKCETGRIAGKVTASCDPFAMAPDTKLVESIDKAFGKFQEKTDEACAGVSVADLGFAGCADPYGNGCDAEFSNSALRGTCSNNGRTCSSDAGCTSPATCVPAGPDLVTPASLAEVQNCLRCNAEANAGQLHALADTFAAAGADKALAKCQQTILKQSVKLAAGLTKGLGKCEKTSPNFGGSCPGGKDLAKAAKTAAKLAAALDKNCLGLTTAVIGVPASCPATDGQGFATGSCATISLTDLDAIAECATCIAARSSSRLTAGNCGNGYTDFEAGETCDDGNQEDGDSCPADCRVAACTLDPLGATTPLQVAFEAPDGVDVAALELFVTYPEHAVLVPGSGDISSAASNTPVDASVTVIDTDAGLSVIALDASLAPIPQGALFDLTVQNCVSQTPGQVAISAAPWEALAPVSEPKFSNYVCIVVEAADTNLNPVDGVTCEVVKP